MHCEMTEQHGKLRKQKKPCAKTPSAENHEKPREPSVKPREPSVMMLEKHKKPKEPSVKPREPSVMMLEKHKKPREPSVKPREPSVMMLEKHKKHEKPREHCEMQELSVSKEPKQQLESRTNEGDTSKNKPLNKIINDMLMTIKQLEKQDKPIMMTE
eukprot:695448-Ditylum_brightwellii.AAC.1